jgi:hypothetical protein
MLKFSGGERKVPVIVEGEKVTIGYGGTWGVWELTVKWATSSSFQGSEKRTTENADSNIVLLERIIFL